MEPTAERSRALSAARAHLDRGFRFEQGNSFERAMDAYRDALAARPSALERIEAHLRIARVHRHLAQLDDASREAAEAIRLADQADADDLAAEAMNVEVGVLQIRGRIEEADVLAQQALARARTARVRGITLQNLGRGAAERQDFNASDRYFEESIEAFRSTNYEIGLAVALTNAARAALDRGDPTRALTIGEEAIALTRRLNVLDVLLTAVQNQAAAHAAVGQLDAAESLLTEALGHFTSARNPIRQAECLEIMGQLSDARGDDAETARRCYSRARELAIAAGDRQLIDRLSKRLGIAD